MRTKCTAPVCTNPVNPPQQIHNIARLSTKIWKKTTKHDSMMHRPSDGSQLIVPIMTLNDLSSSVRIVDGYYIELPNMILWKFSIANFQNVWILTSWTFCAHPWSNHTTLPWSGVPFCYFSSRLQPFAKNVNTFDIQDVLGTVGPALGDFPTLFPNGRILLPRLYYVADLCSG